MPSLARPRLIAVVACALSLACASASSNGYRAPRLVTRNTVPPLAMSASGSSAASRAPLQVTIEVEVDPEGRADIETLKLTGPGALENRGVLETWLASAMFEPARQNGEPVRGTFKMTMERRVTVEVRRR